LTPTVFSQQQPNWPCLPNVATQIPTTISQQTFGWGNVLATNIEVAFGIGSLLGWSFVLPTLGLVPLTMLVMQRRCYQVSPMLHSINGLVNTPVGICGTTPQKLKTISPSICL
jgi:hypothetical protein